MTDLFDVEPEEMENCEGCRRHESTVASGIYRCVSCVSTYCKYGHLEIPILLKPVSDSTGLATAGHDNLHTDLAKGDPMACPMRRSLWMFSDSYMGS